VGLISHTLSEIKKRKGKNPVYNIKEPNDRKALGMYALEAGYLAFAIAWKVYVGNGLVTGEWNPLKYKNENIIEKERKNLEKGNKLEKTINYEDLLK
jgi:hypothetical protein